MTMESEETKVHAISQVVVAIIVSIGVVIAAVILAGGDYGRDQSQCMPVNGGEALKAMTTNKEMNVMMMDGNMEIGMQRARYDYDTNTILVETPARTGGLFKNASIAFDYGRSLVFIHIHGEKLCYASALGNGDMMDVTDRLINFMTENELQVIDILKTDDVEVNYIPAGVIPPGYVSNSNGPIIRAMCAGDISHWTIPRVTQAQSQSRKKRRSGEASVRFCIFGYCFNINF